MTSRELGISKNIAGVNMRLNAGGVRGHKAAEWSYMLYGTARITAIDAQLRRRRRCGRSLWYFPPVIPHSIQGINPDSCEFLLIFAGTARWQTRAAWG